MSKQRSSAAGATSAVVAIAVIPPIAGHDLLSYAVPASLVGRIHPGMRVLVPLGTRQVTGIVVEFSDRPNGIRLRDVLDALDEVPLLSPELLKLCRFTARYYMTSLGEVLATAVLAGLRAQTHRWVRRTAAQDHAGAAQGVTKTEREILRLLGSGRRVRTATLARAVRASGAYEALRSLAARGIIEVEESAPRAAARVRYESVFRLGREPTASERSQIERRAKMQWRLLERVTDAGARGLGAKELREPSSGAAVRALVARGLVCIEQREIYRLVVPVEPSSSGRPPIPNADQGRAIECIGVALIERRFEPFLLRGVTGSGKTEVYLQAAARTLDQRRGVLILVPEIALTPDLVDRVCGRFGGTVALLHSSLSASERFDEWRRLARGEASIAVGVRSAVFAPVRDLGLVIVDEEHDGAYKQEEGLRYNARDLAIVRARDAGCPVVLASATPSIESHHNARIGRYQLLELPERVEKRPLPIVDPIDLRTERPEGDPPVLAPRLRDAIIENLASGGQTLLFLNRRGYAHYLQCTLCGFVMECPNCSVTLTFHLRLRRARCHHCDYSLPAPDLCPQCVSPHLRDFGIGTEQVEAVVRDYVPGARVARMDRDTVSRKGALTALIGEWNAGRLDVLVGTQMVTKGHDVPGVTLVGVVASDQMLNFPDFRAAERTFQILTQVAGRAGRGDQPGRVLVQTYRPSHYAVRFAIAHDFLGFAEEELRYREALGYPPYSRLVNLRFDGLDAERVERLARRTANDLREANLRLPRVRQAAVLGPAPAPIERLRGRYRWQILLKGRDAKVLQSLLQPFLRATERTGRDSAARLSVDVDPYGML
jgi:primosomal protein N' (replication factor Y) (superfamily II helicase)